jgi:hypothetical protein
MKAFRSIAAFIVVVWATTVSAQSSQRGFSVILLLGETQSASGGDGLPQAPGVRKALADVKDFLPYRSYHVLDTQLLQRGSTRMKGIDDQEYEVEIAADEIVSLPPFQKAKPGVFNISFKLKEAGAAENSSEEFGRSGQVADMERQLAHVRALLPAAQGAMAQEQKSRIEQLEKQIRLAKARKLLDSHFEMAPGETVVVGTSKIGGGDRGLVALLTFLASGAK